MSNFDGVTETANIVARVRTLETADRTVHESGVLDETTLPRYADGSVKDYIVVKRGRPIPTGRDRGMGVGERGQPHIVPYTVVYYSADPNAVQDGAAEVTNLLLDFLPNGGNATGLKAAGGYAYTRALAEGRPARYEEATFWVTTINLSTGS